MISSLFYVPGVNVIAPVESSFVAVPTVRVPPKVIVIGMPRLPPPSPPRPVTSKS